MGLGGTLVLFLPNKLWFYFIHRKNSRLKHAFPAAGLLAGAGVAGREGGTGRDGAGGAGSTGVALWVSAVCL